MKSIIVICVCLFLLSTIVLSGCNSNESDNSSDEIVINENLISAAAETSSNFNSSGAFRGDSQFVQVPIEFWASEIELMEPIKVYSHNNNIAIVIEDTESEEEGIYVYVSFSSYLPESDDSIEYTAIEEDIYRFIRRK